MKKDIILMKLVVLFLAISSFSLILVPFSDYDGSAFNVVTAIIAGVLFWLFLILGYLVFAGIAKHRKVYEKKATSSNKGRLSRADNKKKPGIVCFFSNKFAMIADIVLIASFILTLVMVLFIPQTPQVIQIILISLLLFSLHMHCVLNGINFRYIRERSK